MEIPREQYDRINDGVKEMSTPYHSAEGFINNQIEEPLGKYEAWKGARKRK